jgi:hypothetical protein
MVSITLEEEHRYRLDKRLVGPSGGLNTMMRMVYTWSLTELSRLKQMWW